MSTSEKCNKLLKAANTRLKSGNCGFKIEQRGQKLSLRGTLPPRPGSDKTDSHSQRVSLGVYANPAGIKVAENKAKEISAAIALGKFNWQEYIDYKEPIGTTDYWAEKFEEDYFRRKGETSQSLTTWKTEYLTMFKRLPEGEELSIENLGALVFSTEANSRARRRAVMVANAIAKFAGIDVSFSKYRGNYTNKNSIRDLPSDKDIAQMYHSIPNDSWRFAFGLIACYGISNHELFHLELDSLRQEPGHLVSTYRKGHFETRRIWCLYPEWWRDWELYKPRSLPNVTGKTDRDLGHRVTKAFKRYKLCTPLELRHCWAIRAINFIPNAMAARMMAHTEEEHFRTYQRWINEDHEKQFYQVLMSRSDRPKPPST